MLKTRFTELIGCEVPIQAAAMPGVSTLELAAAVSNAGGLGNLGAPMTPPAVLAEMLDGLSRLTTKPFAVNFLIHFLDDPECVDVAAERARLVEFFYGEPDRSLVDRVRSRGKLAMWQVGSVAEAIAAEQAGCDMIVAQGVEAGGHVRGTIGLLPLLGEVVDAVKIPVVAAGGISTARAMAGALAAGAAAVRVGTRFIATRESGAHPKYVEAILGAKAEDAEYTEAFSVMWPNAPHRVLRSSIEAAKRLPEGEAGEIEMGGRKMAVQRFSVFCPSRDTTGRIEAMALYAGQSVGAVRQVKTAAEVVGDLAGGAARLLGAWAGRS